MRRPQDQKNLPLLLTKLSNIKTSGRFFQNLVVFSEKLNFKEKIFFMNTKALKIRKALIDRYSVDIHWLKEAIKQR
jgi:hypothetical protein